MNTTKFKIAILGIGLIAIFAYYQQQGGGFGGTSKLLVLMLHESELDGNIKPAARQAIPTSKLVVEYLDAHCYGGRDGWRYWDNDTDASHEDTVWQEALKQANEKYTDADGPVIIISNGTSAGVGNPWADSPEEQVKVLQKWGGP